MLSECQTESMDLEPKHHSLIMGVVRDGTQWQLMSEALQRLGAEVEVLPWLECARLMENGVDENCERQFGRMEHQMVQRFQEVLADGEIVFGAEVEPNLANQVAKTAIAWGAHDVVYYWGWIVTVYEFTDELGSEV